MNGKFYEFCDIVKKLRSPEGCPWDREQTHQTLAKHLLEEAYEAYDAVLEGKSEKIADELGDVLLQIVMHAQIGSEENTFDIETVINAVSEKMIVRHPHVFGDAEADTPEKVLSNWEDIKRKQRGQKKTYESMEDITRSLPALTRAYKVWGKAEKLKFEPEEKNQTFLKEGFVADEESIGAAFFELCRLSREKNIDPEEVLSSKIKNFIKNVKNIEENT